MPHVNIKYFPVEVSEAQKEELVIALTWAVQNAFGCDADVISIALEPIQSEDWDEKVVLPEIDRRKNLLCKVPNYWPTTTCREQR